MRTTMAMSKTIFSLQMIDDHDVSLLRQTFNSIKSEDFALGLMGLFMAIAFLGRGIRFYGTKAPVVKREGKLVWESVRFSVRGCWSIIRAIPWLLLSSSEAAHGGRQLVWIIIRAAIWSTLDNTR